jgi:radical SAM superfamily enzyme YgiQ (UPF0313 family)
MEMAEAVLTLQHWWRQAQVDATRLRFSAHRLFARDHGPEDCRVMSLLAADIGKRPRLALYADRSGEFLRYMIELAPELGRQAIAIVADEPDRLESPVSGVPVVRPNSLPAEVATVLLCETLTFPRMQMRRRLPGTVDVVDADRLVAVGIDQMPARAWTPWARDTIYPMDVPEIEFEPNRDLLLIDCPARNLGLMPNGVGYVHNALKYTNVNFQTRDLDIILYHRFHIRRLFDEGGTIRLPNGRELPADPWQAEHYDLWSDAEVLTYFRPEIDEIIDKIAAARPKILAMSVHSCNEHFSAEVVKGVKQALPEIVVVVGGFSCYSADIGLRAFPLADYMCIGEADLTVGPLVERLVAGERPANTPGVLSKFDDAALPYIPGPMPHDLDLLDHPQYEWYDLPVYQNYNGYQLTPVIASRGCRWSRCTFCAERFYWRIRTPKVFVDELEWLVDHGCRLFMFNESDLNGMPELVVDICDEVINRQLNIKLTGQLRIHKKADRAFYRKLREAGFVALRFGVDAFSENTLRLQKKGYVKDTVRQNLRDCWEAGIYTEVNWVIGVPGETDADVEEGIEFILENKPYIGRLANINPLILVNGGVYWLEPDKHNIHFRETQEELYARFPRAIPAHLWYSTQPYIDQHVRKARFERIVLALHEGGFPVGAWAQRVIEDVHKNRDINRGSIAPEPAAPPAETPAEPPAAPAEAEPARAVGAIMLRVVEESAAEDDVPAPDDTAELRLSDGIGSMEKPEPQEASTLEFNADARSAQYVFRAGSALPEDKIVHLQSRLCLVRHENELYGIAPDKLTAAFSGLRLPQFGESDAVDVTDKVRVRFVKTKAAVPELVRSIGNYNVVLYDAMYYGVPQALGAVGWGEENVAGLPGVVSAKTLGSVSDQVEKRLGLPARRRAAAPDKMAPAASMPESHGTSVPRLVGALEGYNIVEYEGWFYGVPQGLGDVHLDETDVIEMPGVVRDLSREVVEGEIREAVRQAVAT